MVIRYNISALPTVMSGLQVNPEIFISLEQYGQL
jgi:hypothetical protein